jgi:hypothetical protein
VGSIRQEHFGFESGIEQPEATLFPTLHGHTAGRTVFKSVRVPGYARAIATHVSAVLGYEYNVEVFDLADLVFDPLYRRHIWRTSCTGPSATCHLPWVCGQAGALYSLR